MLYIIYSILTLHYIKIIIKKIQSLYYSSKKLYCTLPQKIYCSNFTVQFYWYKLLFNLKHLMLQYNCYLIDN